jgi:predicted ArsR family transcriptional regulator
MLKEITMIEKIPKIRSEELKDRVVINDLETLKVLSDPLRMQIIELMSYQARTVKQLAKELGTTPHKLYYHVKLLEDHGLIRVAETRMVSGIVEKHYQIVAKDIVVADGLLSVSKPERKSDVESLISSILDGSKADFIRSLRVRTDEDIQVGERHSSYATREIASLTREQAKAIYERLEELVREFESYDDEAEQGQRQRYALTTLFYPSFSKEDLLGGSEEDAQST